MRLMLLCLALTVTAVTAASPSFCGNKKCPPYTVLSQGSGYEIRKYKPSVWVEAMKQGSEGRREMFGRLFQYMRGQNEKAQRLQMTVPVVGHLGLNDEHSQTMRFYLGEDKDGFDPPKPTDSAIHLHHDPEMTYYVMPFRNNAWRNINTWKVEARKLLAMIPTASNVEEFCGASYGPKESDNMYNEVWIHTSSDHRDHHFHHHNHNDGHDHHHGDHDHDHDDVHGHDHGGGHNH